MGQLHPLEVLSEEGGLEDLLSCRLLGRAVKVDVAVHRPLEVGGERLLDLVSVAHGEAFASHLIEAHALVGFLRNLAVACRRLLLLVEQFKHELGVIDIGESSRLLHCLAVFLG